MDEHNVHHFWGITPGFDLRTHVPAERLPSSGQPLRFLQVAPYDVRHTLYTLCRNSRHAVLAPDQQVQLYIWEDCPEGLARHLLLLAVALDASLPPRQRAETLLELHGNALLRDSTAAYLDSKARQLEVLVVSLVAGGAVPASLAAPGPAGLGPLASMVDLSMLKFQDKDDLVDVVRRWRLPAAQTNASSTAAGEPEAAASASTSSSSSSSSLKSASGAAGASAGVGGGSGLSEGRAPYDMVKSWDSRARKWYGDRFDFRRNMIDWDYHMRLQAMGTPGQDASVGSIIHFHHFRYWRMHGVAYELRDCVYNATNRSLLSTAYGRTREFKDRAGKDVGRSVAAWGFWADILNSPYHCFGTACDDASYYRVSNKQFMRTGYDVAEYNVMSLINELRTGNPKGEDMPAPAASDPSASGPAKPSAEGNSDDATMSGPEGLDAIDSGVHRSRAARGPTSFADLSAEAEKSAAANASCGNTSSRPGQLASTESDSVVGSVDAAASALQGLSVAGSAAGSETETTDAASISGSCMLTPESSATGASMSSTVTEKALPAGTSNGKLATEADADCQGEGSNGQRKGGLHETDRPKVYSSGGRAQAMAALLQPPGPSASTSNGNASASNASTATAAASAASATASVSAASTSADGAGGRASAEDVAAIALAAREADKDAAAAQRCQPFKLVLLAGDLTRTVTSRAKFAGAFAAATLGHRHMHLLGPEYRLADAVTPGGLLLAESAKYVLQLKPEQADAFKVKMDELACSAGWRGADAKEVDGDGRLGRGAEAVLDGVVVYARK